ncbi:hypothetical protein ACSAZK_01905 [Methanosarcina sp. Mfa9]|uniref:hypothetical protein n=1 Tax=Methanosarcina sp. Mfa9 TaxID=3439063 RepID=UPI003F87EE60
MERPIGVTILAIGAALLAVVNGLITLRFLGFLPFLGPLDVRIFNLWYALLYGLLTYVWAWLTGMLWNVNPQAWLFLAVIVVFNLCIDFVVLVTGGTWYDINVSVILNGLLLVYLMLPGVRSAFGTD